MTALDPWAACALTLAVGTAAGLLFKRFKVPAGYMIGAFAGVAALGLTAGCSWVPPDTKVAVQVIAGAFVGCSMERGDVARLRRIGGPVLLMLGSFLVLNLALGFAIWAASPLDLVTALMCAVPGGINDTPIVAADMGADAPAVTALQLIRQILGIGVLPALILAFDRRRAAQGRPDPADERAADGQANAPRVKSKQKSPAAIAAALGAAAAAGIVGRMTGIPGMTFAFAIVAVLVLKLAFDFAYLPKKVKKACQIVAGCYLGTLVTAESLAGLAALVPAVAILVAGYTLNCFLTGRLERALFGYGRKEGMLIASPAGASDMALIIDDLGVKNTDIVIMQVVRAVVVMSVFPQMVNLICFALGGR